MRKSLIVFVLVAAVLFFSAVYALGDFDASDYVPNNAGFYRIPNYFDASIDTLIGTIGSINGPTIENNIARTHMLALVVDVTANAGDEDINVFFDVSLDGSTWWATACVIHSSVTTATTGGTGASYEIVDPGVETLRVLLLAHSYHGFSPATTALPFKYIRWRIDEIGDGFEGTIQATALGEI